MQVNDNITRTSRKKILDLVLYLLISLAVVGSIFVAFALGVPHDEFMRWFGLIGATLIIFVSAISQSRALWDKKSFWVLMSAIFIAHCSVFARLEMAKVNLSGFKVMVTYFTEVSMLNILKNAIYREHP